MVKSPQLCKQLYNVLLCMVFYWSRILLAACVLSFPCLTGLRSHYCMVQHSVSFFIFSLFSSFYAKQPNCCGMHFDCTSHCLDVESNLSSYPFHHQLTPAFLSHPPPCSEKDLNEFCRRWKNQYKTLHPVS